MKLDLKKLREVGEVAQVTFTTGETLVDGHTYWEAMLDKLEKQEKQLEDARWFLKAVNELILDQQLEFLTPTGKTTISKWLEGFEDEA